ncbi:hypothetical protein BASA61_005656 [Batrachochytrium salamandrivorans]|nr:hypothetical protein BASA61_005656 [Batrachochytrium salamandrivorans]
MRLIAEKNKILLMLLMPIPSWVDGFLHCIGASGLFLFSIENAVAAAADVVVVVGGGGGGVASADIIVPDVVVISVGGVAASADAVVITDIVVAAADFCLYRCDVSLSSSEAEYRSCLLPGS